MLFAEKEAGRPKSWSLLIGTIITVLILNVSLIIIIRVLLDSEDELDEPIIKGEWREHLSSFISLFTLSFFFGCWCCFCCGGLLFKWIIDFPKMLCKGLNLAASSFIAWHAPVEHNPETTGVSLDNFMEEGISNPAMILTSEGNLEMLEDNRSQEPEGSWSPASVRTHPHSPEVRYPRATRAHSIQVELR